MTAILPRWWPTLCALGAGLSAVGVISGWIPVLLIAIAIDLFVLSTYVVNRKEN